MSRYVSTWRDSLFIRIFLVQMVLTALMSVAFLALVFTEQIGTFARTIGPIWAAALRPVLPALAQGQALPAAVEQTVPTRLVLLPGPPPAISLPVPMLLRYRILADALRTQGIPVRQIRLSRDLNGNAVTWLALEVAGHRQWVGIQGGLGSVALRGRSLLAFVLTVVVFLAGSWWFSRRLTRPLARLDGQIKAYAANGMVPDFSVREGPLEIRQLSQCVHDFMQQHVQQDEMRQIMLAGVSHDLRSPLARIRMAADLLPDDQATISARESIVRNVQLADRLLSSFLDLARASAEPLDEMVNLGALFGQIIEERGDDRIHFMPEATSPLILPQASAVGLERMLQNLLDNALRYGQPPVLVCLSAQPEHLVVVVRDHGPGIPQAEQSRLLQPFYRGDHARSMPGTGLGLAVVMETARRHDARVVLRNVHPGLEIRIAFARVPARNH